MSEWKYISPDKQGYRRVKVTRRQHNRIFTKRHVRFGGSVEWYYDGHHLIIHRLLSWWIKIPLVLFVFPVSILIEGIPEACKGLMDVVFQKSRGKYSHDDVFVAEPFLGLSPKLREILYK